ncbi:MAG TPA: D-glycerate dehydrogenase [Nitrospira sp.]|nr:D-glycerate dehydrogenase [Nitrospira sp.]
MAPVKPPLYVSRLLPNAIMEAIRERFTLVQEPGDVPPAPALIKSGFSQAVAAIVTLTDRIDSDILASSRDLKIVANYAVGYNNIDVEAARQRSIVVTNTPDVLTDATADLTWALILATARRVIEGDRLVRDGRWTGWTPTQLLGTAVAGGTLGIIGMGRIGQAVARRAAGFGMKVLYHSRRPIGSGGKAAAWEARELSALLAQSDFVTLHVPLTPETRHLIGAAELAQMRRTAMLINTARGPIVDEAALVAALTDRTIAGAGLDVYEDEPRLHPGLASLPQVVLLPHLGSATMAARVEMGLVCVNNIEAVLAGRPALHRVS